ncbi:MAG TPA: glycosyltransferase family 2 protein [Thermoanaerobaculia bacterium]|nr:glycosyltransferase family 2 protein [Thermoanaerobaculia bacterium]
MNLRKRRPAQRSTTDITPVELPSVSAHQNRSTHGPIDVSILIVTWNSAHWIASCLEALEGASGSRTTEVIVFDNASSDSSFSLASSAGNARLRAILSERNRGFAGGVNCARRESVGRYLLLLNPDCELDAGSIESLAAYLDLHEEVAAAVPLLRGEDGTPQREFQFRRLPTLGSTLAEVLLLDKIFPSNRTSASYRYRELDLTQVQQIEQPAAAAMMIRREVAETVGDLDEQFAPAWFEDVDFCMRLRNQGGTIHLVPSASGVHRTGSSLQYLEYGLFIEIWYLNLFRYARKWFSSGRVEVLRWAIIVGMALRIAVTVLGAGSGTVKRNTGIKSYCNVMKKAFSRWNDPS